VKHRGDALTESQSVEKKDDRQDSHIKPFLTIEPAEYMKDRVVYKIKVYDKLGDRQKLLYLATSTVGIVVAASVPAVINLGFDLVVPTVLSLIVTILVSAEKLFHFREHWRNYDEMAAFLRSEQLQFQTGSGEYKDKGEAFDRFVTRVEGAISNERKDTIEMRTQETNAGLQGS
jgi:hypothetical protein